MLKSNWCQGNHSLQVCVIYAYRIASNFRGGANFRYFMVDLAVTKFSHPRKLMSTYVSQSSFDGHGHKQRGQYFPVLAIKSSHYHPADSVFDTNFVSHVIYLSHYKYSLVTK